MAERGLAEPSVDQPGERRGLSWVWLVPIATLVIFVTVLWQTYGNQGPLVSISFERGTGIEAGKTPIRHRGIQIGLVESIALSAGAEQVEVQARMDKSVADRLVASTRFWRVSPRVTGTQVSGLDTLLGGTYIGVSWEPAEADSKPQRRFKGLDNQPLTPAGTPGRHVVLIAREGAAIAVGAPLYFKNIPVGRIETRELDADGTGVVYKAFIDAPYDARVSAATRFWNVSGFSLELGAEGARLRVESLLTLLEGGVAFDSLPLLPDSLPAGGNDKFRLYPGQTEAMESLLESGPDQEVLFSAVFSGSVRGLVSGAPVEYRGVQVGDVKEIQVDLRHSQDDVAIATVLRIQPLRISQVLTEREQILEEFKIRVERGMRAQLARGNLLTGALYVNLVDRPDDPPAVLDVGARPYPRIPSVPSDIAIMTSSAQSMMARLQALPLEQTLGALTRVLDDAHVLLASDSTKGLPARLDEAVANIAALAGAKSTREVPGELSATLRETRTLVAGLNGAGIQTRTANTLASAERAAAALEKATQGLPELVKALTQTARNAESTLAGLKQGSELHYELQRAVAEVKRAAQAVGTLANKLSAKPNSIILGK